MAIAPRRLAVDQGQPLATSRSATDPGRWLTALVGVLFLLGALYLYRTVSGTQAILFLLGGLGGLTLYHAHFGFTSAFRRFLVYGQADGLRVQMLMLVVASVLFLPLLVRGSVFGHPVAAGASPLGTSVLVGAFIFGIGMQLADGCASGTLYHLGGGDIRSILAIVGYVVGSVLGSLNFNWWTKSLPSLAPVSLLKSFGPWGALAIQVVIAGVVALVVTQVERRRYGRGIELQPQTRRGWQALLRGPWPLVWGAVALAFINFTMLLVSGKPWGVTFAFALWGAKLAQAVGIPAGSWAYWQSAANAQALQRSVIFDQTTVTDIGLMLGALLAGALAFRFAKPLTLRFPPRMLVATVLGGTIMGYGARIAFGCNIGAYFSGIASFSVHGWVWFVAAMLGSAVGVKLRPLFAYKN